MKDVIRRRRQSGTTGVKHCPNSEREAPGGYPVPGTRTVAYFSPIKHRASKGHGADKKPPTRPQGDGFVRAFFRAGTAQEISYTFFLLL